MSNAQSKIANTDTNMNTTTASQKIIACEKVRICGWVYLHDTASGNCYDFRDTSTIAGNYTELQIKHFVDNLYDGIKYNDVDDDAVDVAKNYKASDLDQFFNDGWDEDFDLYLIREHLDKVVEQIHSRADELNDWVAPNSW